MKEHVIRQYILRASAWGLVPAEDSTVEEPELPTLWGGACTGISDVVPRHSAALHGALSQAGPFLSLCGIMLLEDSLCVKAGHVCFCGCV